LSMKAGYFVSVGLHINTKIRFTGNSIS
jgi:hypothetical protein